MIATDRQVRDAILDWVRARGPDVARAGDRRVVGFPFRQTTDVIRRYGTARLPADLARELIAASATVPVVGDQITGDAALDLSWFTPRWLRCATAGLVGEPSYAAYVMCDLTAGYCRVGGGADFQENAAVLTAVLVADLVHHELFNAGRSIAAPLAGVRLAAASRLFNDLMAAVRGAAPGSRRRMPPYSTNGLRPVTSGRAGGFAPWTPTNPSNGPGPVASGRAWTPSPEAARRVCAYLVDRLCRDRQFTLRALVEYSPLPTTTEPDEYLFVRAVQATEVLVAAAAWQADQACGLGHHDLSDLVRRLELMAGNLCLAAQLIRLLATVDAAQFATIRVATRGTSALQSPAFAALERRCRGRRALREEALTAVGLDHVPVPDTPLRTVLESVGRRLDPARARRLAETAAAVDGAWLRWKRAHHGVTKRVIGDAPGTGGTEGLSYLVRQLHTPLLGPLDPRHQPAALAAPAGQTGETWCSTRST